MPDKSIPDCLMIRRAVNGWIIFPGGGISSEFTHIAASPQELATHVQKWAAAQVVDTPGKSKTP
jgi:8-oxo-dGTP pyrophosphatase MutT (NUDIX family)